jgi:hypothetical protein
MRSRDGDDAFLASCQTTHDSLDFAVAAVRFQFFVVEGLRYAIYDLNRYQIIVASWTGISTFSLLATRLGVQRDCVSNAATTSDIGRTDQIDIRTASALSSVEQSLICEYGNQRPLQVGYRAVFYRSIGPDPDLVRINNTCKLSCSV